MKRGTPRSSKAPSGVVDDWPEIISLGETELALYEEFLSDILLSMLADEDASR